MSDNEVMSDDEPESHQTSEQLAEAIATIMASPKDAGELAMVVRRPDIDAREVLQAGASWLLEPGIGLTGDNYVARGDNKTDDGAAHPEAELNLMNSRAIDAVCAGASSRWQLAGDQLFVDFDLSRTNLPTGTRLLIGEATIEVTAKPHNGCAKFGRRFGMDAARWVNSDQDLRLRGINARVVAPGLVSPGDQITKLVKVAKPGSERGC